MPDKLSNVSPNAEIVKPSATMHYWDEESQAWLPFDWWRKKQVDRIFGRTHYPHPVRAKKALQTQAGPDRSKLASGDVD
jgi:hypothetical protein